MHPVLKAIEPELLHNLPDPTETSLVLSFRMQGESGETVQMTETLRGEEAEFLPHIVTRMLGFLSKVGFDVNVEVPNDETGSIGPALGKLMVALDKQEAA